jgi:hypothetical protein
MQGRKKERRRGGKEWRGEKTRMIRVRRMKI